MIYTRIVNDMVVGFYTEANHGIDRCIDIIKCGGIVINPMLWRTLLHWHKIRFVGEKLPDKTYTIADFEELKALVIPPPIPEKTEIEKLQDKVLMQDELININMMATDEIFVMIEPLLQVKPETYDLNRMVVKQPMVDMYVAMVMRGLKTIDEVPARYRAQVKVILDQLEK